MNLFNIVQAVALILALWSLLAVSLCRQAEDRQVLILVSILFVLVAIWAQGI